MLTPSTRVFPLGPGAFRRRWDELLKALHAEDLGLTPGGLRGGGAVYAYSREGFSIPDICWKMRITKVTTLEHYIQDVVARQVIKHLSAEGRDAVASLSAVMPPLLRLVTGRMAEGGWAPLCL